MYRPQCKECRKEARTKVTVVELDNDKLDEKWAGHTIKCTLCNKVKPKSLKYFKRAIGSTIDVFLNSHKECKECSVPLNKDNVTSNGKMTGLLAYCKSCYDKKKTSQRQNVGTFTKEHVDSSQEIRVKICIGECKRTLENATEFFGIHSGKLLRNQCLECTRASYRNAGRYKLYRKNMLESDPDGCRARQALNLQRWKTNNAERWKSWSDNYKTTKEYIVNYYKSSNKAKT